MREIVIGAAQMGPIQKADSRAAVVERMIALLDRAKAGGSQAGSWAQRPRDLTGCRPLHSVKQIPAKQGPPARCQDPGSAAHHFMLRSVRDDGDGG